VVCSGISTRRSIGFVSELQPESVLIAASGTSFLGMLWEPSSCERSSEGWKTGIGATGIGATTLSRVGNETLIAAGF
jgi:hypothetical protein